MRRSRLATLFAGVLMAAILLPSAAVAATAPAGGGATTTPSVVADPAVKLGCALVIPAPRSTRPRIVCRWSALEGADVAAYRLWRSVDGGPRRLVTTVPATGLLRHADFAIRAGHTYRYQVVARHDGMRLGTSAVVSVRVGRPAEALRFNCVFLIDGATRGVRCHWSASNRPAAVRYVLFRSVDGAAREAVYRTSTWGRRSFLDTHVVAGQKLRYAVVAFAADGRVVGVSHPDVVRVP